MRLLVISLALGSTVAVSTLSAQQGMLTIPAAKPKQYVSFDTAEQAVKAGKKSIVELRFKVGEGFHVNSHKPSSELLIPTNLTLKPAAGVTASAVEYPAGKAYSFSFEPGEKLDVYTSDFVVKVQVVAEAGLHTVAGVLRYQACDNAACYPPKSLPVEFVLNAK